MDSYLNLIFSLEEQQMDYCMFFFFVGGGGGSLIANRRFAALKISARSFPKAKSPHDSNLHPPPPYTQP